MPPKAAPALLDLLTRHLGARPASETAAHRAAAYALVHGALRFREADAATSSAAASSTASAASTAIVWAGGGSEALCAKVEASAGRALLQLTTCLNESQLRPLFLRALGFATDEQGGEGAEGAEGAEGGGAAGGGSAEATQVSPRRVAAFLALLEPSQRRFAALYSPYFALAAPLCITALEQHAHAHTLLPPVALRAHGLLSSSADELEEAAPRASKRRKGALVSDDALLAPAAKAAAARGAADAAAARVCCLSALRCLAIGLSHHTPAAPAATAENLAALQPQLAAALTSAAAVAAAAAASASADANGASGANGAAAATAAVAPAAELEAAALRCVGTLASAAGADGVKRLHYRLCELAGSADETPAHLQPFLLPLTGGADAAGAGAVAAAGTMAAAAAAGHAAARRAALDGLQALYEPLGESALALVAEALPVASEAMEDADTQVRTSALKLMRTLEEASMEDVE